MGSLRGTGHSLVQHNRILIVGTGPWGYALAILLGEQSHVDLVTHDRRKAQHFPKFLPATDHLGQEHSVLVPHRVQCFHDEDRHLSGSSYDLVILACNSPHFESRLDFIASICTCPLLIATKGLTYDGRLLSIAAEERLGTGREIGVLCGPNIAPDVVIGPYSGADVAFRDLDISVSVARLFSYSKLKLLPSTRVDTLALSGALKNVYTIAAALVDNALLNESIKGLLVARAAAEMTRLQELYGTEAPHALEGLHGIGDFYTTSICRRSRNYGYGKALAEGNRELILSTKERAEGNHTAEALSRKFGSRTLEKELPILNAVCSSIRGEPISAVLSMMQDKWEAFARGVIWV